MKVAHSHQAAARSRNPDVIRAFASVSSSYLRKVIDTIAVPRHAVAESANNKKTASWIKEELESFGYEVGFQGQFDNVVATSANDTSGPVLLVGAHYDSVPGCPGADDNASAVAVMLGCARAVATLSEINVCFVAFNREEDGFLGSADFVDSFVVADRVELTGCHILEMVGFCSQEKGSQKPPRGLPVKIPDVGNFLGLLGNGKSTHLVDSILSVGKTYLPDFPVLGLKPQLGVERLIPDLNRSDHVPFWQKGIPATMWTDTADFRNPNYHRRTDTPETLNYGFMSNVTKLLIATVIEG